MSYESEAWTLKVNVTNRLEAFEIWVFSRISWIEHLRSYVRRFEAHADGVGERGGEGYMAVNDQGNKTVLNRTHVAAQPLRTS